MRAAGRGLARLGVRQRAARRRRRSPSHVGALDGLVAPYAPERPRAARPSHDYVVAANWKVVTENYHECYHCPLIHPGAVRGEPADERSQLRPARRAGSAAAWTCATSAETMSLDGAQRAVARIDGRRPAARCCYLGLLPNLLLSLHPDYVMTHRLTPLAPDRTRVECSWYFPRRGHRPVVRRGLLGPHQPAGLGRLRVGAARPLLAALPARPAGPERGRGAPVRHDGGPRLPGCQTGRMTEDRAAVAIAVARRQAGRARGRAGRPVGPGGRPGRDLVRQARRRRHEHGRRAALPGGRARAPAGHPRRGGPGRGEAGRGQLRRLRRLRQSRSRRSGSRRCRGRRCAWPTRPRGA